MRSVFATGFPVLFVLMIAATAFAARDPERPATGAATLGPAATSIPAQFDCGTYAGNEAEHHWLAHRHRKIMKEVRDGQRTVSATAAAFVYKDVWVVEDDGTLLISGINPFDTDTETFRFTPNGDGTYTVTSVTFSWDATLGGAVTTGDDGHVLNALLFTFDFGGSSWTQAYVGGNGLVTFGAVPNPSGFYDPDDFFNTTPKICPYYMDLNPDAGGNVHVKNEATRTTVTWSAVPEYGTSNFNTVQVVLRDDDSFDVSFNGIASTTAVGGSPIYFAFHPGGASSVEPMSYSDDLPYTTAVGNGAFEDYLNILNPIVNEAALFQKFYQTFPDEFFQLIFFSNFVQTMGGFANERNISNDVTGIGLSIFDLSGSYGSSGVLESRCNMNRLSVWPADPTTRFFGDGNNFLTIMGQEAGHRWGAFLNFWDGSSVSNLILGRSDAHWSYYVDNDHSSLEGGNWEETTPGNYICPTQIDFFPPIDEYTFGLRLPEEVSDIYYLDSPTNNLPANRSDGTPPQFATASGSPVTVTVNDIIAAEGARTPTEATENKDLRQGWILIHQMGTTPTVAELDKVALFRAAWEAYFEVSCDGRLTCNTSLATNLPVGVKKGFVKDATTQVVVPGITAYSVERTFDQFVPAGGRYIFRYQADTTGATSEAVTIVFSADGYYPDTLSTTAVYGNTDCLDIYLTPVPTSVQPGTSVPNALYAAYPNPFNPATTIRFDLAGSGATTLIVYDVRGREVRTLVRDHRDAGVHIAEWDGRDSSGRVVASGVYFYRLEQGAYVRSRKMVLSK